MARTIDVRAHQRKRGAILDILERLIATKGYDQLTIADIMSGGAISKGAFYHYFRSKSEVLSALLERRVNAWRDVLIPVVEADRPALPRLREFFHVIAEQKTTDNAFLLEVAAPVFADENVLVYARTRRAAAELFIPLVQQLLEDARREGSVQMDDAEATAEVVISLIQDLSDRIGRALVAMAQGADEPNRLQRIAAAHLDALHRVLGVEPGVLDFLEPEMLEAWAAAAQGRQMEKRR
ncbi:TetR/AcrR family transcriptional regulator [Agromyces laixinhei]|uniref:TetR/AcrR family transcriptional regulator n=1 Tax=Agromyces laixinhei TaxID=2585717 RepID=UPI0011170662|nr:TetR/AcrR family transcriptional regulator [Agromyces laixinhei]